MSLMRSQEMEYCHLMCNEDSSWDILNELGDHSSLHFVDPEPGLPLVNRPFANYIKRCDDVNVKINSIKETIDKFQDLISNQHKIVGCRDYPALLQHFKTNLRERSEKEGKKDGKTYFFEIEDEVHEQQAWMTEQLGHFENLAEKQNQLKEYTVVLKKSQNIVGNRLNAQEGQMEGNVNIAGYSLEQVLDSRISMNQIVGVIDSVEALRFQRMVFRVTKGNAITILEDVLEQDWEGGPIKDPVTRKPVEKKVFVIVYPGGVMDVIKNKLNRICDSFNCSKFGIPQSQEQFINKLAELRDQKKDADNLVQMTEHNLIEFLKTWMAPRRGTTCSKITEYELYTVREKGLYHSLNLLKTDQKIYKGFAWIPKSDIEDINQTLQQLSQRNPEIAGGQIRPQQMPPAHVEKPPTYFKTNDFTGIYQLITNTYGTPRYLEVNPALFSLITFPFLFGVMYGDIAHGSVLFLVGILLCLFNDKIKQTSLSGVCFARYFVLLMGFFALYNGLLYNDFTSIGFNFFGSCYEADLTKVTKQADYIYGTNCPPYTQAQVDAEKLSVDQCYPYKYALNNWDETKPNVAKPYNYIDTAGNKATQYFPVSNNCVYPFGIDPVWTIAGNNIEFINSYKMKLSVIIGVIQMSLGICLKAVNAISFKQPLDFIFEFVPQIVFMSVTFGYMDFMIFYKWFSDYQGGQNQFAPSIITLLINMPLQVGKPGDQILYGGDSDKEQTSIQFTFLITALIMIPLMLLPKPLILNAMNKKKHANQHSAVQGNDAINTSNDQPLLDSGLEKDLEKDLLVKGSEAHVEEEAHDFGELFVHQVIETIEFVLGSISNTASYLRLWALSLAHSQLAEVFFKNGIQPFLQSGGVGGAISLVFGYYVFALITFGVLLTMDVMECFLHALRLHWVEFQNKFFKADGVEFKPFSFTNIMRAHDAGEQV